MVLPGATHRGSRFVGRSRELGVLIQLLHEGLERTPSVVRVAGSPGSGRRRLIHEALLRGPDAEWIELAPGGIEADFPRWIRTELIDLLESYPNAPIPSWCFHVLARHAPVLKRLAPVPSLSPERMDDENAPELLGSAVGSALFALTAESTVLIDAGLWPETNSATERSLNAMTRAFGGPGIMVITAIDDDHSTLPQTPEIRTLALGPLQSADVGELTALWNAGPPAEPLARWLFRVTGGHPFFLHETVRWLEELGHVHVDDDLGTVQLLDPPQSLPLPLGLRSVIENRFRRLAPSAAYLMSRVAEGNGTIDLEALRDAYEGPEEGFEEALAALRRRCFLLRRSPRYLPALTSTLWSPVAVPPSKRKFRRTRTPVGALEPIRPARPARSPLSRSIAETHAVFTIMLEDPEAHPTERLAELLRGARRRGGPAWNGIQGRLAALAALIRFRQGRLRDALRWTVWGNKRLTPDRHPSLRRTLGSIAIRINELEGDSVGASEGRRVLLREALTVGHLVTSAKIRAAYAEGLRRLGHLSDALSQATVAGRELSAMGDDDAASLAGYTRLRALTDSRRLEEAMREVQRSPDHILRGDEFDELGRMIADLPSLPELLELQYSHPAPAGWGYGLEDNRLTPEARAFVVQFAAAIHAGQGIELNAAAADLDTRLERAGLDTDRADLAELTVFAAFSSDTENAIDSALKQTAILHDRLGSDDRSRFLASALHRTQAATAPTFGARFRSLLLQPTRRNTSVATTPNLRLYLLGRGRIETEGRIRPLPLWPEWWTRLLGRVVSYTLLDRDLTDEAVAEVIQRAGEPPDRSLDDTVERANRHLWQNDTGSGPGGFRRRKGRWTFEWTGIWCDARIVLEELEASQRADETGDGREAVRLRETALAWVSGAFLPKLDTREVVETRSLLAARVLEGMQSQLRSGAGLPGDRYADWLEGPGRLAAVDALIASRLMTQGWTRAARALLSPSVSR